MNLLLVAMLLATQAPAADPLLRLEDDWAVGLTRRDAALFQRLLADGFVYTENDRTMSRDDVLRDIVTGSDTVTTAHNEDMKVHRFGTTAIVTGWLVVSGHGPGGGGGRSVAAIGSRIRGSGGMGAGRSSPLTITL
jgi:uncharacterized protein DUF4440